MKVRLHWAAAGLLVFGLVGCSDMASTIKNAGRDTLVQTKEEFDSELRQAARDGVHDGANAAKEGLAGGDEEDSPEAENE